MGVLLLLLLFVVVVVVVVSFDVEVGCWIPWTFVICIWRRNFDGNVFEQRSHIIDVDNCSFNSLFVPRNVFTDAVKASGLGIAPGSLIISSTTSRGGLLSLDCCWAFSSSFISLFDRLTIGSEATPWTLSLWVLRKYLLHTC